jgi:D-glucuronyl C5-epimerase-like protein
MRQMRLLAALAASTACALSCVAPAEAGRLLVFDKQKVRAYEEPALPADAAGGSAPSNRVLERWHAGAARVRTSRRDPVKRALSRALLAGQIQPGDRDRYLEIYRAAVRLRPRLGLTRARELGYAIDTLRLISQRKQLTPSRMPALFLILDRNREWWGSKGPPASGARVRFAPSEIIFQYYPGRGLQLQPLANFGFANGLWQSSRDDRLRALIGELVPLRVSRGSFSAWEYYFHFGGGSPPWISGMAQATAMQAIARAGTRLGVPSLLRVASEGVAAFERSTPGGVRVPASSGAWYALYSFAPRLEVLNGMLQALIGLDAYRTLTGDPRGSALFDAGDALARARIGSYDTGAWSLYSRSSGRDGAEADLNYHKLNRDFARRLCRITAADPYCSSADNFSAYLREDPRLVPFGPAPAPARAGRGVRFHFTLSKVGRVGITVRAEGGGRTYLSTSAPFSRGKHSFRWIPPRSTRDRTYEYSLFARDLAGNTHSDSGTLRVKPSS